MSSIFVHYFTWGDRADIKVSSISAPDPRSRLLAHQRIPWQGPTQPWEDLEAASHLLDRLLAAGAVRLG
jgi:hypothetical protein